MTEEYEDVKDDAPPTPPVFDPVACHIRVLARLCDTCVFHPANPMYLAEGRLKQLVDEILAREGHLICHSTLPGVVAEDSPAAICRGFANAYGDKSYAIRVGRELRWLVEVEPPATKIPKIEDAR